LNFYIYFVFMQTLGLKLCKGKEKKANSHTFSAFSSKKRTLFGVVRRHENEFVAERQKKWIGRDKNISRRQLKIL